ncbi:nucleotidyltransferase domain-containing protein [Candidatus Pacearchaeota archaeon]|nr:nucleotidyltransferase domain-containing protein [Candidatus Pacearchaeota archaeon]
MIGKVYKVLNIGLYSPLYRTYDMYILNEEHKISAAFLQKPWKQLTYLEIRKLSGKKSKSYIYRALSHLMNQQVINTEQVGKSLLYGLTLDSTSTQSYLGALSEYLAWQFTHVPEHIVENLASKVRTITPFFVFIVTGSYAKKTQTKKSDLDVTIICDDHIDPKAIEAEIGHEAKLSIPQVHLFVFRKKDFLEMLVNKEFNYGKEVARNNMIFFGGNIYYSILNEAIGHGFRG